MKGKRCIYFISIIMVLSLLLINIVSAKNDIPAKTNRKNTLSENRQRPDNRPTTSTRTQNKINRNQNPRLTNNNLNNQNTKIYSSNLQNYINAGESIMFIESQPGDSQIIMPGTLAMAGGDKENNCYVVCIGAKEKIIESNREERLEAINWFTEKYLTEYIWLNYLSPLQWDDIKIQITTTINSIKPDIIITYSPYGYSGHPEKQNTSKTVSEIYNTLEYTPKLYYIINTNQDIAIKTTIEKTSYTPTEVINLKTYSEKLGKTIWEAKLEIWEKYSDSIQILKGILGNTNRLQKNDKYEYFMQVEI